MKLIRACTVPLSFVFIEGAIPEIQERFQLSILSSPGENWKLLNKYGEGIKRFKIEMARLISPIKDLKSLCKIIKLFSNEKPAIVHSMTPKAGLLCMIAGKITRVPIRVHTFTGLVFPTSSGLKKKILMAADRLTCACATHIIPEGEGIKRDLLNNHITKKHIKVLGNGSCKGIDLEYFNLNADGVKEEAETIRKELCESKFRFISIGRMVGDKGINELVEAFNRLQSEFTNIQLLLVGPQESELDPLNKETLKIIEKCDAIKAVGAQEDVRPWLAASNCAVLPSYREGFPNVVLEAGAMGLPQIVTDINGANEIIEDGKNGLIVPPKDVNALYTAMKIMVEDQGLRNHLKAESREMIASRYDKKYVIQCLMDFYDEVSLSL